MNRITARSAFLALCITGTAACGGSRNIGEFTPGPAADFRTASTAEVRTAQDQVLLTGHFVETTTDGDDVERTATLAGTAAGTTASGAVEVESCRAGDCDQEVEFEVVNATPKAVLRLIIDGKPFGTVITDDRGRASVERDVPLPR